MCSAIRNALVSISSGIEDTNARPKALPLTSNSKNNIAALTTTRKFIIASKKRSIVVGSGPSRLRAAKSSSLVFSANNAQHVRLWSFSLANSCMALPALSSMGAVDFLSFIGCSEGLIAAACHTSGVAMCEVLCTTGGLLAISLWSTAFSFSRSCCNGADSSSPDFTAQSSRSWAMEAKCMRVTKPRLSMRASSSASIATQSGIEAEYSQRAGADGEAAA
mmetsp:Transcript_3805/g.11041  ORF Transcript_3805/g.11041 Transcript_3805/m.11041 type:complete len:220 (-) Transcript_3805:116-775(-)